jgi:hypothetical protein
MPLVTDVMVESAFEYLNTQGEAAAQAKADLIIAEHRRKKTRAEIIVRSPERTMGMKEAEAECHPDYWEAGLVEADAAKAVEWHRHNRARAEAIIEAWRTQESTNRSLGKI